MGEGTGTRLGPSRVPYFDVFVNPSQTVGPSEIAVGYTRTSAAFTVKSVINILVVVVSLTER